MQNRHTSTNGYSSQAAKHGNTCKVKIAALTLLLTLLIVPATVLAERHRFVLDYSDSHFRGHRGEGTTLYLKKALRNQYPWVNISNLELNKVVLVAKTKKGMGDVQLRIGSQVSVPHRVAGTPRAFHSHHRKSFDRIRMQPPNRQGHGPWQLFLRGNFMVRKVVLVVDEPRHRPTYGWWRYNW